LSESVSGKPRESLLLVLGFSGFVDYEHEDDDETEPSPTFSKHALSVS